MSSSVYFNPGTSSSSTIPNLLELMGDQYDRSDLNDHHQVFFGPTYDHVACQALDRNPSTYYSDESCLSVESSSRAQNPKVETAALSSPLWPRNNRGGSGFSGNGYYPKSNRREIGDNMEIEATNPNDHSKNSKKWKSSKVRIMQRMMATSKNKHMGEDRQHNKLRNLEQRQRNLNNNNNNNGAIRVCSDCRTTTTPLWRSGPQGPKSLCNACGIRQRKARRAAMAAEFATDNGNSGPIIAPMKLPNKKIDEDQMRERGADCHENHPLPLKKRGKITDHDHGDQYGLSSSHNNNNNDYVGPSYYYSKSRVLARDEEEGAILLMALSCGLA